MNPFEMVIGIVLIVSIASIIRAKMGLPMGGGRMRRGRHFMDMQPDPETERLRDEVRGLKERVAVLERLITDQSSTAALDREFEKLRQKD